MLSLLYPWFKRDFDLEGPHDERFNEQNKSIARTWIRSRSARAIWASERGSAAGSGVGWGGDI